MATKLGDGAEAEGVSEAVQHDTVIVINQLVVINYWISAAYNY